MNTQTYHDGEQHINSTTLITLDLVSLTLCCFIVFALYLKPSLIKTLETNTIFSESLLCKPITLDLWFAKAKAEFDCAKLGSWSSRQTETQRSK